MKNLILAISLLMLFAIPVFSQATVTIVWDHDGLNTSGFEIERYTATHNGTNYVPPTGAALGTYDVSGGSTRSFPTPTLPAGIFAFRARAYNVGDPATLKAYSGWSNWAYCRIPAGPNNPTNTGVSGGTMTVQFNLPDDRNAVVTIALNKIPEP